MGRISHRQGIGIMVLTLIVAIVVGATLIHPGVSSSSSSGVTLREANVPPASESSSRPPAPSPPHVSPDSASTSPASAPAATTTVESVPNVSSSEVVVHVAGAVKRPGVYHLRPGTRNDDALKAAGGPAANANTDAVNLAARVEDGTQLYIPTRQEQPQGGASGQAGAIAEVTSLHKEKQEHPLPRRTHKGGGKSGKAAKLSDPNEGQININTASAEELERVPGIGPAMAERILAYRQENHSFQSVEDLLQVSGIGESKFAKMQPFIKVR